MNLFFRVDASVQIGTGHLMRCLTIANKLKEQGAVSTFICRHVTEAIKLLIIESGYSLILLPKHEITVISDSHLAHARWLGIGQAEDAQDTLLSIKERACDWLIIDHYALDIRWESALRQSVKKIMVIDDIADREHDCDILLDQNLYIDMQSRYSNKVPEHCQLLLGPRYALVRTEFLKARQQAKVRKGDVKRILVFFGGVDANNYTGITLIALQNLALNDIAVDVVIGAQHPNRDEILSICKANNFICHIQIMYMAELMLQADLSIGAGGSAMWERCSLGLPTIVIPTADNQVAQIKDAALSGLIYVIETKVNLLKVIERHILTMIDSSIFRQVLSENAMQLVDGRGVLHIIEKMGLSEIVIRNALKQDSEQIFAWRNHSNIRAVSKNSNLISWQEHQKWFSQVINDLNTPLLIGELNDLPVGVVRFDVENKQAKISIYVIPEKQSSGYGSELLSKAESWLSQHYPEVTSLHAEVLGGNSRSHRLFKSANYQIDTTSYFKRLH